jgi:mRNA interferase RelE/StbE
MRKPISVFYTTSARKDLQKLNSVVSRRIVLSVERYTATEPLLKAKALSGELQGLYRYRIGDYRVLFAFDDKDALIIITILRIKNRKDAYQ